MKVCVFFLALIAVLGMHPAFAASSVVACGTPHIETVTTDPGFEYCDIHNRRFAYKESYDDLKQQIEERHKSYNAPRQQVIKDYQQRLEEYYKNPNGTASKEAPSTP